MESELLGHEIPSNQALEKSFNAWLSNLVIDLGAEVIPIFQPCWNC
jgi:hypothetical protein